MFSILNKLLQVFFGIANVLDFKILLINESKRLLKEQGEHLDENVEIAKSIN